MYISLNPFVHGFSMNQIKHIPLEKILPPEFDHRLSTSPLDDDELAESIREMGIMQPVVVKDTTKGYEIVFGNRRYIAAGKVGLKAIPCVIVKTDAAAAEKMKLHENLNRLPLSHVDQGYTFAHLIKQFNMTEKQIGKLIGKSIGYISQHLSLLSCDDILIQAVHDGRINFSVARELVQCKDEDERSRLANLIEENGASVAVVHSWVNEANRETDILEQTPDTSPSSTTPETPVFPMYPCAICQTPVDVRNLNIIRMCFDCKHTIFSEIDHNRMKQRQEIAVKPSEHS